MVQNLKENQCSVVARLSDKDLGESGLNSSMLWQHS